MILNAEHTFTLIMNVFGVDKDLSVHLSKFESPPEDTKLGSFSSIHPVGEDSHLLIMIKQRRESDNRRFTRS